MRCCKNCGGLLPADSAPQRRYCGEEGCNRERARLRQREHRRVQWRLVEWTNTSEVGGRERDDGTRVRKRERTIVDLKLGLERQPDDRKGRWLDDRATWWLTHCPMTVLEKGKVATNDLPAERTPGWEAFAEIEDRAILADESRRWKESEPAEVVDLELLRRAHEEQKQWLREHGKPEEAIAAGAWFEREFGVAA